MPTCFGRRLEDFKSRICGAPNSDTGLQFFPRSNFWKFLDSNFPMSLGNNGGPIEILPEITLKSWNVTVIFYRFQGGPWLGSINKLQTVTLDCNFFKVEFCLLCFSALKTSLNFEIFVLASHCVNFGTRFNIL